MKLLHTIQKWLVVGFGALQIPILLVPYIDHYHAFGVISMCFSFGKLQMGGEYILEFLLPVALSVIGAILILIRSNLGLNIAALCLNLVSVSIYFFGIGYFHRIHVAVGTGRNLNLILVFLELLLCAAGIVFSIRKMVRRHARGNPAQSELSNK